VEVQSLPVDKILIEMHLKLLSKEELCIGQERYLRFDARRKIQHRSSRDSRPNPAKRAWSFVQLTVE
jgi:hypothetical protein